MQETDRENGSTKHQVLERLTNYLRESNVEFRTVEHEATTTSEESAKARGEPLEVGAKALLLKVDNRFLIAVLPASAKLDSAALRTHLPCKSIRFATQEELLERTGLAPGSLPPFGKPIFDLQLIADPSVGSHESRVAFNAGSLTTSVIMSRESWLATANPEFISFIAH